MITIRNMIASDVDALHAAFEEQGWHKPREILEMYFSEHELGSRRVFVAVEDGVPLGYATVIKNDEHGAFRNMNIPTVTDFNVFINHQRKGAGTAILDSIEDSVRKYSDKICLGVGLHSGYGSAQRMYVKRGYVPDGSGVWYQNKVLGQYQPCVNDDDLILYFSKQL